MRFVSIVTKLATSPITALKRCSVASVRTQPTEQLIAPFPGTNAQPCTMTQMPLKLLRLIRPKLLALAVSQSLMPKIFLPLPEVSMMKPLIL